MEPKGGSVCFKSITLQPLGITHQKQYGIKHYLSPSKHQLMVVFPSHSKGPVAAKGSCLIPLNVTVLYPFCSQGYPVDGIGSLRETDRALSDPGPTDASEGEVCEEVRLGL